VRRTLAILAGLACCLGALAPAAGAQERPRWNTRLLARILTPGYPAMAYVHPNQRIYVGTYVNPQGDSQRSRVFEYEGGALLRSWTVPGQDLSKEHGVQVATSDSRGRLLLLDRSPARALLLDRGTGGFREYATFADLPACPPVGAPQNCSPSTQDLPAVPNYAAWGTDGSLFVTDFEQAVIWRVPRGGGTAQVWLADARLDGGQFGTTGIALAADRRTLVVAQGSSGGVNPGGLLPGGSVNPTTGKIFRVAIGANGNPGQLQQIYESGPAELPDGFAIASSGNLYVPLASANQIAVLGPDGRERERFPAGPDGSNGSGVPFDTPTSARFQGTRLIVANQSFGGTRENQATFDVETREAGLEEFVFGLDRTKPRLTRLSVAPSRFRKGRGRGRGTRFRFRLSERAKVVFRVERRTRRGWSHVGSFTRARRKGRNSLAFSGRFRFRGRARSLRAGRYRLKTRARDAAGNRSRLAARRFRVVR
jgi:sugar lactone lactonase YvrE